MGYYDRNDKSDFDSSFDSYWKREEERRSQEDAYRYMARCNGRDYDSMSEREKSRLEADYTIRHGM